ncbi:MAG TPA: SDR family NAD(P)-dependent oxidoreductase [Pyrinomonadaceae bacterium]|nr:SDR family NAD(P)-dependent oxidoreductase [Pyrinomonadaceae bacterium]
MRVDWSKQVVLITGASSGIGHAVAVELGRRGASVGLFARRAEMLLRVAEEVEREGGRALALPGDVRDAAQVNAAAARVREMWGRIDVLVANAGMSMVVSATDLRAADVSEVISINTIGVVNSVAAVLPDMVARRSGHLVAVSSLAAYRGLPKSSAYSASKAAVSTFFESLRVDLRKSGIAVTTIHPGFIKTPLTANRKSRLPFLLELDDAARRIVRAIERRPRTYAFPWQLASLVRLMRYMPDALYDRIAANNSFRE